MTKYHHRPTMLCVVYCAFTIVLLSSYHPYTTMYRIMKLAKLKMKFRPFKTDKNEIQTHATAVMLFCLVFLCLFWR